MGAEAGLKKEVEIGQDVLVSNLVEEKGLMEKLGISDIEYDGLKETANIGTGHAAIALSNILKKKVNITLPDIKLTRLSNVSKVISFPSGNIVGVYSKIEDGLNGNIITMFPIDVASSLLELFYPEKKGSKSNKLEENDRKLLVKIGTATYMSYLSSLAKFFEKKIYFNPPNLVTSFGDSIFDFMSLGVDSSGDVLVIKLGFDVDKTDIKGDFLLLFTLDSLSGVLSTLKSKVNKNTDKR